MYRNFVYYFLLSSIFNNWVPNDESFEKLDLAIKKEQRFNNNVCAAEKVEEDEN